MKDRKSQVACPNCGHMLMQPDYVNDHHDWDCFNCNFEMPGRVTLDGLEVITWLQMCESRDPVMEEMFKGFGAYLGDIR